MPPKTEMAKTTRKRTSPDVPAAADGVSPSASAQRVSCRLGRHGKSLSIAIYTDRVSTFVGDAMLSRVLQHLEALRSDLDTIDPEHHIDAADRVAGLAVALRDRLAEFGVLDREERGASADRSVA